MTTLPQNTCMFLANANRTLLNQARAQIYIHGTFIDKTGLVVYKQKQQ